MISANIYFISDNDLLLMMDSFKRLPEIIRPVYFTDSEKRVPRKNLIDDQDKFQEFFSKNTLGFFLSSKNGTLFNISIRKNGFSEISMNLADNSLSNLISDFFICMTPLKPIFGYASDVNEYEHRNRYFKKIGNNNIESWVGRDLNKFLPGLYWKTLLSDNLIARHEISLENLMSEVSCVKVIGDGSLHELLFFENASDWMKHVDRLDILCENNKNIFSIRRIDAALKAVENFQDYDKLISDWR